MAEKQAGTLETPEGEDGGARRTCRTRTAATGGHHPGAHSRCIESPWEGRHPSPLPAPASHPIHFPKCKSQASHNPGDIDFLRSIHSGRKNESEKPGDCPGSDLLRPLSIKGHVDEPTSAPRMSAPWGPFLKQEPTEGRLPCASTRETVTSEEEAEKPPQVKNVLEDSPVGKQSWWQGLREQRAKLEGEERTSPEAHTSERAGKGESANRPSGPIPACRERTYPVTSCTSERKFQNPRD